MMAKDAGNDRVRYNLRQVHRTRQEEVDTLRRRLHELERDLLSFEELNEEYLYHDAEDVS